MFLQTSESELGTYLSSQKRAMEVKYEQLEARKVYLERQKTSLEGNIQELVAQCHLTASA